MVVMEHVSADKDAKHACATCWKYSPRLLSGYFRRCNKMHTRGDYFATISVSFLSGASTSAAARRLEVDRKANAKKTTAEKRSTSARGA